MHIWTRVAMMATLGMMASTAVAAIQVDGQINEPEWQQARRFTDFVSTTPFDLTAVPADAAIEAFLLSTPEGLAVALRSKQPAGVQRITSRVQRDFDEQIDRSNFMIDFDADGKTAYDFTVSAGNDISDEVVVRENQFSKDWDADWQHAVTSSEEGYTWEWLIPWSITSMKPPVNGKRTIAVYFDRVVASNGRRYAYPAATYTRPRFVSDFAKIEIDAYEDSLLAITPYGVALADLKRSDQEFKAGADVFWKPNSNHQFALTLNPDFGQVESDDLVVNFDAIETFFTDKRPFFTDNQSAFDSGYPGGNLFYTRRVGGPADDDSGAADINAAIKANGNVGNFGYAFFGATEDGRAGRDFLFGRVSGRSEHVDWDVTQIAVDRPFLDRQADVTAIHGRFKPSETWTLDTAVHHSQIDENGVQTRGTGGGIIADWDMPGPFRQQYFFIRNDGDVDLNDLGYQDRNNNRYLEWETGYRQDQLPADSIFASHAWELELVDNRNLDGEQVWGTATLQRYSEMRDGSNMFFFVRYRDEIFDDLSSRGNGSFIVQSGMHFFTEANLARRDGGKLSWYFNTELIGSRIGNGYDRLFGIEPRIHFSDQLDWSIGAYWFAQSAWLIWQEDANFGQFDSERLDLVSNLNWFIDDRQELRVKLQAIGIEAEADQAWTIGNGGLLVPATLAVEDFSLRNLGFQIRYRYKLGNLSDIFAVYSRGGAALDERPADDVFDTIGTAFDLRDDDQFLVKFAYRFEL